MDNICAGIVSYNPDIERLKLNVEAICGQVSKVYIVDNGSENLFAINNLIVTVSKVVLIPNTENVGIAKALNQLCEIADNDHYQWMLTLDQDTICPKNLIELLSKYINRDDVGLICPAIHYEGWCSTEIQSLAPYCEESEEIKACMTSGSLTRIKAWKKVKGFREEYFIDFVDNEFCMKLLLAHYKIIRVNTCAINHQLGESGTFNLLGIKKVKYTRHTPWRFYYMIRNNRVFIEEYKNQLSVFKEYLKLWYIIIKGIAFAKDRKSTIRSIYLGYKHAKQKKLGKLFSST